MDKITSLAELKRMLKPGITLTLVNTSMPTHKYLGTARKIIKTQTNAVQFEGGSWLYHGKAGDYTFTENGFILDISNHERQARMTQYLEYSIGDKDKP